MTVPIQRIESALISIETVLMPQELFHSRSLVPFTITGECSTDKSMQTNLAKKHPHPGRSLVGNLSRHQPTLRTQWELSANLRRKS